MTQRGRWIALTGIVLAVLVWKSVRTDWVVTCPYYYTDTDPPPTTSYGTETFVPPVSPFWSPPTPAALTGRETATWLEWQFFEGGGAWGPTEDPTLRVFWELLLAKVLGVAAPIAALIFSFRKRSGMVRS